MELLWLCGPSCALACIFHITIRDAHKFLASIPDDQLGDHIEDIINVSFSYISFMFFKQLLACINLNKLTFVQTFKTLDASAIRAKFFSVTVVVTCFVMLFR